MNEEKYYCNGGSYIPMIIWDSCVFFFFLVLLSFLAENRRVRVPDGALIALGFGAVLFGCSIFFSVYLQLELKKIYLVVGQKCVKGVYTNTGIAPEYVEIPYSDIRFMNVERQFLVIQGPYKKYKFLLQDPRSAMADIEAKRTAGE